MPDLIEELEISLHVPHRELRAHYGELIPRVIAELKRLRELAELAVDPRHSNPAKFRT